MAGRLDLVTGSSIKASASLPEAHCLGPIRHRAKPTLPRLIVDVDTGARNGRHLIESLMHPWQRASWLEARHTPLMALTVLWVKYYARPY